MPPIPPLPTEPPIDTNIPILAPFTITDVSYDSTNAYFTVGATTANKVIFYYPHVSGTDEYGNDYNNGTDYMGRFDVATGTSLTVPLPYLWKYAGNKNILHVPYQDPGTDTIPNWQDIPNVSGASPYYLNFGGGGGGGGGGNFVPSIGADISGAGFTAFAGTSSALTLMLMPDASDGQHFVLYVDDVSKGHFSQYPVFDSPVAPYYKYLIVGPIPFELNAGQTIKIYWTNDSSMTTLSPVSNTVILQENPPYPILDTSSNTATSVTWNFSTPFANAYIIITLDLNGNDQPLHYYTATNGAITTPRSELGGVGYIVAAIAVDTTTKLWSFYSIFGVVPPLPPTTPVPCFLANAPVLTPTGYRRIADLGVGDKVTTADGREVEIRYVKHTRVPACPDTNPYIIEKGQYGATRRLLISPTHRVITPSGLHEARSLGLAQEDLRGSIDYYNLELPSHATDTLVVAGVAVESMAPVRRVTVPLAVFREMMRRRYGSHLSPAVLAQIQRTCHFLADGRVECPIMATKQTR